MEISSSIFLLTNLSCCPLAAHESMSILYSPVLAQRTPGVAG
jgi:hypothetical protein